MLGFSCDNSDSNPDSSEEIRYVEDGRMVRLGDPFPIAVDVDNNGEVDFTIFLELTANSAGDHLYGGINPIGLNLIKSGPENENHYLNMGFLIAVPRNELIDSSTEPQQRWNSDHNALLIRHTSGNGDISYEGSWAGESHQFVGIQVASGEGFYFGWMRLQFDKATERITLLDYALNLQAGRPIKAGEY